MDDFFTDTDRDIRRRAAAFSDEHLIPLEEPTEERGGHWSWAETQHVRDAAVDFGLSAINIKKEYGGQEFTVLQQMLVHEEIGRATNGLFALLPFPHVPLQHGTKEQIDSYLRPMCAGKIRSAFLVTEEGAGSDPRQVKTKAMRKGNGFVVTGEKWFATSADVSQVQIVHAHVDDDPDQPTLFLIPSAREGVSIKELPTFTHNYVFGHPMMAFDEVEVGSDEILGEVGQGYELTKDWFVEARLEICAHCIGQSRRAALVANAYAGEREQFGQKIQDFQAIRFMIADMAVAIYAMQSMVYRLAADIDRGADRKTAHAQASAAKLFCSEQAGKVVDSAVQVLGGRGYMRKNPVERLYRDVRVERIWEGTSEVQRDVIGRMVAKRGLGRYSLWD